MKKQSLKPFVRDYLNAISGKEKTPAIIDKFIADPKLREHILTYEAGFPRYEMIPEDMIEEGNKVVVRMMVKATHKNTFMDIPATGKRISLPLMIIYEIENGKIVKNWMSYDRMLFMEQLGVMQPA